MFEILFSGLITILVIDIVTIVINKLKANKAKYTKSIDEFEVRLDSIVGVVFLISTIFFGLCAVGASTASIENGYYTWIAFSIVAVLSAILVFMFFTNVKVKGNDIVYKKYLPPKTIKCKFSDIAYYSVFADTITLYAKDNKKLFSIDNDMIGSSNLIERLNKENIICSEDGNVKRTIKKSDIIFRNGNVIGLGVLFIVIGLLVAVVEIAEKAAQAAILTGIMDGLIFMIIMFFVFLFSISFIIVPALINIHKIEKGLGINFDEEMAKEGITSFGFKNEKWYLDTPQIIVNRDYIKTIENVKNKENSYYKYVVYHLRTVDGQIMKIKTSNNNFYDWYEKRNIGKD